MNQLELIYQKVTGTPSGDTAERMSRYDLWKTFQFSTPYPRRFRENFSRSLLSYPPLCKLMLPFEIAYLPWLKTFSREC
jgi:hypothetical protein